MQPSRNALRRGNQSTSLEAVGLKDGNVLEMAKKISSAFLLSSKENRPEFSIWIEVTTLIVPTYVDPDEQLRAIALFIKNELGAENRPEFFIWVEESTPVHLLLRIWSS